MPQGLKKKVKPTLSAVTTVSEVAYNDGISVTEARRTVIKILDEMDDREKLAAWTDMGLGTKYFTCYKCGKVHRRSNFYTSTDITVQTRISPICKDCALDLAMPIDPRTGERQEPTMDSCKTALFYMNRAWTDDLWRTSVQEANNAALGKTKSNAFTSIVKNSILPQNSTLTWRDSDLFVTQALSALKQEANEKKSEVQEQFEKNKADVIRLLGYEPFEKESPSDQPFLYAQLVGYLDAGGEANEDAMRVSSIITIVRGFLQQARYDDLICTYMNDINHLKQNMATIKTLQTMKKEVSDTINKLAESSCISLKHNKNTIKGENTWTGKIKKLKDMNLREAEVNGFDLATCKAMYQVMNMSHAAILKQVRFDESDYSDIVALQRTMVRDLTFERDNYREIARILLRENLDLKDILREEKLLDELNLVDLDELYAVFAHRSTQDEIEALIQEVDAEENSKSTNASLIEGAENLLDASTDTGEVADG